MSTEIKNEINILLEKEGIKYSVYGIEKQLKNYERFKNEITKFFEHAEKFKNFSLYKELVNDMSRVEANYNSCLGYTVENIRMYNSYPALVSTIKSFTARKIFLLSESNIKLLLDYDMTDDRQLEEYIRFLNGESPGISADFITSYVKVNIHHKTLGKVESEVKTKVDSLATEIEQLYSELNKLQKINSQLDSEHSTMIKEQNQVFQTETESQKSEVEKILNDFKQRQQQIEEAYSQQMQLKKPIEFWNELSKDYRKRYRLSFWLTIGLSFLFTILLAILFSVFFGNSIHHENSVIRIAWSDGNVIPISAILVLGTITSIIIYALRICVKITMSNKHLWHEAEQKEKMTNFYLTLLKDTDGGVTLQEKEREIIIANLFSKIEAGLIKHNQEDVLDILSVLKR